MKNRCIPLVIFLFVVVLLMSSCTDGPDESLFTITIEAGPTESGDVSFDKVSWEDIAEVNVSGDSVIEIYAKATEDFYFTGWYENGTKVSNSTNWQITVNSDKTFEARFSNVIDNEGGVIEVSDQESPIYGTQIAIPQDALEEDELFDCLISYTNDPPFDYNHDIRSNFNSPFLIFETEKSDAFEELIEIKLPLVSEYLDNGFYPLVYYWDSEAREICPAHKLDISWEENTITILGNGLELMAVFYKSLDEVFTDFAASRTDINRSAFRPDTDGFSFHNVSTTFNDRGCCAGISFFAKWYYDEKKFLDNGRLYEAYALYYDGDGPRESYKDQDTLEIVSGGHTRLGYKHNMDSEHSNYIEMLEELDKGKTVIFDYKDPIIPDSGHAVLMYGYQKINQYEYNLHAYDSNSPGIPSIIKASVTINSPTDYDVEYTKGDKKITGKADLTQIKKEYVNIMEDLYERDLNDEWGSDYDREIPIYELIHNNYNAEGAAILNDGDKFIINANVDWDICNAEDSSFDGMTWEEIWDDAEIEIYYWSQYNQTYKNIENNSRIEFEENRYDIGVCQFTVQKDADWYYDGDLLFSFKFTPKNEKHNVLGGGISFPVKIDEDQEPINFGCPNLKQAVRDAEGYTGFPAGEIYPDDVDQITKLNGDSCQITSLVGIEYLINLTDLWLADNQITDLYPLQDLENLEFLDISDNQVSDIFPLDNFDNLEILVFDNNQVSDLDALYYLDLVNLFFEGNQVSDLSPIRYMTNLTQLGFKDNRVSDISCLQNLTNLIRLSFGNNQVSNVSVLQHLTNLKYLSFQDNQVSDINALENLTKLEGTLRLDNNQIDDINALVENTGLGEGNRIWLEHNNLDLSDNSQDWQNIQALINRGCDVFYEPQN